jgi:hypothetical protein
MLLSIAADGYYNHLATESGFIHQAKHATCLRSDSKTPDYSKGPQTLGAD